MTPLDQCSCQTATAPASNFTNFPIGTDSTRGRFGEVTLERCLQCQRFWLRYFVEYEGVSQSGRWYRGELKPERAVALLEAMPEVVYGGSYFRKQADQSSAQSGHGKVSIVVDQ
jgi:hypothetical protein